MKNNVGLSPHACWPTFFDAAKRRMRAMMSFVFVLAGHLKASVLPSDARSSLLRLFR